MNARFTINVTVIALLAVSLLGNLLLCRDNQELKGQNADLTEKIGGLEAKIGDLKKKVGTPAPSGNEAGLKRLRARIDKLEREKSELMKQLAQQDGAPAAEAPVDQPSTNRVEGFRPFGPPPSVAEMRARFEEMREKDPERYAQITNNMARWRAHQQERLQNQFDILAGADTKHMTKAQRKVHEDYQNLLARQEELHELLNPNNADVTDAQREAAMKELHDNWRQLHGLQRAERETLLTQTANALGYKGADAKQVVDAIKAVYEATGGGGHRGPPGPGGGRRGRR